MDIDLCIGFSGKNTRYAVRINLYSRSTIQGRYFGMDFRGNLILRVDFRLDIQADTIFTPIHRYIAIAIGNRNRDTAANQDIRGFPESVVMEGRERIRPLPWLMSAWSVAFTPDI